MLVLSISDAINDGVPCCTAVSHKPLFCKVNLAILREVLQHGIRTDEERDSCLPFGWIVSGNKRKSG